MDDREPEVDELHPSIANPFGQHTLTVWRVHSTKRFRRYIRLLLRTRKCAGAAALHGECGKSAGP